MDIFIARVTESVMGLLWLDWSAGACWHDLDDVAGSVDCCCSPAHFQVVTRRDCGVGVLGLGLCAIVDGFQSLSKTKFGLSKSVCGN